MIDDLINGCWFVIAVLTCIYLLTVIDNLGSLYNRKYFNGLFLSGLFWYIVFCTPFIIILIILK